MATPKSELSLGSNLTGPVSLPYGISPLDVSNPEAWSSYKERLSFFYEATGVAAPEKQRAIFMTVCGDNAYVLLRSLLQPKQVSEVPYKDIVKVLDEYFMPKPSEIVRRVFFMRRTQRQDESIATYAAELKKLSEFCNYSLLEEMLRDRFVAGIREETIQRRLFEETDLTFKKAYELALAAEASRKSVSLVRTPLPQAQEVLSANLHKIKLSAESRASKDCCYRCGGEHDGSSCRFKTYKCNLCGKVGHLARACRSRKGGKSASRARPAHGKALRISNAEEFTVGIINRTQASEVTEPIIMSVNINGKPLSMEIDSGAGHSMISEATLRRLWPVPPKLVRKNVVLKTWSKETLPVLGAFPVEVRHGNDVHHLEVLIAKGDGPSLIGRNWFKALNISVDVVNTVESMDRKWMQYPVFQREFGRYTGPKVTLNMPPSASPIYLKSRQIPFAMRDKVDEALEVMIADGILEPVTFSNWATPIVPVFKKDGSVRICGDYKATVNRALLPDRYPLPTADEIFGNIAGGEFFSKLDLYQAYLQLEMDDKSSDVLTLNTHRGLYRVKRLPYGISAAPGIFQRFMENLLSGISGVAALLDDIIISGHTVQEHDERISEVLTRLSQAGLKLNEKKCVFLTREVTFLGFCVDARGIRPTQDKVDAIRYARKPSNVRELQSFLGLLNFYDRFLPNKATELECLYRLLDKNATWKWAKEHDAAFHRVKQLLRYDRLLVHYDVKRPLTLSVDASPYGLGAMLSHVMDNGEDAPVFFASRTMTTSERNYAQVDREALAIIFGITKFRQFVTGRRVTIYTDHKPLVGLFNPAKPTPTMISPRMLRWSLQLGALDYQIIYRPGKEMLCADALSRLPVEDDIEDNLVDDSVQVLMVEAMQDTSLTALTAQKIADETSKDRVLRRVTRWVLQGWSKEAQETPDFFKVRNELSILRGCLLRGDRVVIPESCRQQVLQLLHAGHQGVVRTKALARSYVWWPGLDRNIEQVVGECRACQATRNAPSRCVHPWPLPNNPWERLHADFAGPFNGNTFLIVVDSFSKWPEVVPVSSMTVASTCRHLRTMFATHGIPHTLVTDNAPTFTSAEFEAFLRNNGVQHILSPAYHPASNGQAERTVQTVKQELRKRQSGDLSTRLARILLTLRTTPSSTTGRSPAELLMRRKLRTILDLVYPSRTEHDPVVPARSFAVGELVQVRQPPGQKPVWQPGRVISRVGRWIYLVEDARGFQRRCHVNQLRRDSTCLADTMQHDDDYWKFNASSETSSPHSSYEAVVSTQSDTAEAFETEDPCPERNSDYQEAVPVLPRRSTRPRTRPLRYGVLDT
ncbi:uncharacterized protein K02A2.6-like [Ornithodoros turicata]|uniref:uncharacterized protein K02A2.6-like n=1 Tax=Ornithodoros turicata TaxID=34597 RepID=UPI00313A335A